MNLDSQLLLNQELLGIYDSIKQRRSFDNGWANCEYGFRYGNIAELNARFRAKMTLFFESDVLMATIAASLQISPEEMARMKDGLQGFIHEIDGDGDADYIQKVMYDLALTLREQDGHTIDNNYVQSDDDEGSDFYDTDHPKITEIKALLRENSEAQFLEKVKETLSVSTDLGFSMTYKDMGVSAATYFSLMYYFLLDTIVPNAETPLPTPANVPLPMTGGSRRFVSENTTLLSAFSRLKRIKKRKNKTNRIKTRQNKRRRSTRKMKWGKYT
jgi:hypothetical protein